MKLESLLAGIGMIVGAIGLKKAYDANKKIDTICNKLDTTIDNLVDSEFEVTVPDSMVDAAIEKAAVTEVERAVRVATNKIVKDFENDISKEVKDTVSLCKSNIKDKVTSEITHQVAMLSVRDLREEVTEEAKKQVLEKFDGNLDDILEKFNSDLENVSKIYKSIAKTMTRHEEKEKEMTFKIS